MTCKCEETVGYAVIDRSGKDVFTAMFDSPLLCGSGFTFNGPEGEDWLCPSIDHDSRTIVGVPIGTHMAEAIFDYHRSLREDILESPEWGFVETKSDAEETR